MRLASVLLFVIAAYLSPVAANAHQQPIEKSLDTSTDGFLPFVELSPFVVRGDSITVEIHARTKRDRRYGEKFAHEVMRVAHETMGSPLGRGLVIVGEEREPHPLLVFRDFLRLSNAGQLNPTVGALAPQVAETIERIERGIVDPETGEKYMPVDADVMLSAVPIALEGACARLYRLAWNCQFHTEEFARTLSHLQELGTSDQALSEYDWVFYLPPRSAFTQVLRSALPAFMEEQKLNMLQRASIRTAAFTFRPALKTAMEAIRKGLFFATLLRARTSFSEEDINALKDAYTKVLMPDFKFNGGTAQRRAIEAIETQKRINEEYASNPFVALPRLANYANEEYWKFIGEYRDFGAKHTTHRFRQSNSGFSWQYLDRAPKPFFPAGPTTFVSEKGEMTLQFLISESGEITGVEERWARKRKTVPRN